MIDSPSGLPAAAEGISRMKGFAMGGRLQLKSQRGLQAAPEGSIDDASTRLMEHCYLPGSESALAFT